MATKVTFTLDDVTVSRIEEAAERLRKPKSAVVRDAIADFYERLGRLSEKEKAAMLRALDEYMSRPPSGSNAEVDRELREIRRARRNWRSRAGR